MGQSPAGRERSRQDDHADRTEHEWRHRCVQCRRARHGQARWLASVEAQHRDDTDGQRRVQGDADHAKRLYNSGRDRLVRRPGDRRDSERNRIDDTVTRFPLIAKSVASDARVAYSAAMPTGPLNTPDGTAVRVVHIVAELAPFARSGGLGEAVNSLARFQSASGQWTAIVMPLYDTARENAPAIEPVGPAFNISVG